MQKHISDAEWAKFLSSQRGYLERMVGAIVRHEDDVEDVIQTANVNFWRARRRITWEGRIGFLRKCARREALRLLRRRRCADSLDAHIELLAARLADDPQHQALCLPVLDAFVALYHDHPGPGTVTVLRMAGFTSGELAEAIGMTEQAVNTQVCRFRGQLRENLAAAGVYHRV